MRSSDALRTAVLITVGLVVLSSSGRAQAFKTSNGKVAFVSETTLESFTGQSGSLNGLIDLDKKTVDFFLDMNTVKTGISLRDEHMRGTYLETKKYPFAEFTGHVEGFNPASADTQRVTVKGTFTVHGVAKERTITGRMALRGDRLFVDAHWEVALSEHDIEIPKVMFLKLADIQQVSITAELIKTTSP